MGDTNHMLHFQAAFVTWQGISSSWLIEVGISNFVVVSGEDNQKQEGILGAFKHYKAATYSAYPLAISMKH